PTLSLYPDEDPKGDVSGVYYSREKLEAALSNTHEPAQIQEIHKRIMEFDAWVERTARIYGISTVTVALVNDHNVIYQRGINANAHRKYPVVSFTKPFTAIAILQLAEKGKLDLDAPVNNYVPGSIYYHPRWNQVTIRHLLTHTSGVTEGGARIAPPGTRFAYSNNGYRLLGRVVYSVTGMPVHKYFQEFIIRPMQMNHTDSGYRTDGAAGMWTSTTDLRKFLIMHLSHGKFMDQELIKESSYAQMFGTPAAQPHCEFIEYRGIAWRIWSARGRPLLVNHAALWYGMGGTMQWYPEYHLGWIFMSNPVSHNHPAFRAFYLRIRARLNTLAVAIADMKDNPNYIRPCYYQTVTW
ncbi:MAG: beta-lactamase family protein, partial [Leptospiraceae bacterium]|nr:beta-lactamase family protein [Leptospiraceae bacterium]